MNNNTNNYNAYNNNNPYERGQYQPQPRRVYRSRNNRILTGVCGGLAEYLGVSPMLVRVLAIVLLPAVGSSFWIYLLCSLLIPEEPF